MSEEGFICPICESPGQKTRDHIIPAWFIQRLPNLGVAHEQVMKRAGLQTAVRYICMKCNGGKSGVLDYSIPLVRKYMKALMELLMEKVDPPLVTRHLKVKCACLEGQKGLMPPPKPKPVVTAPVRPTPPALVIPKEPHEMNKEATNNRAIVSEIKKIHEGNSSSSLIYNNAGT